MKTEISTKDLAEFAELYRANSENSENSAIASQILAKGLRVGCRTNQKYKFKFNVTVPRTKIYHQHDRHQCNIYAFLRVVKDILRQRGHLGLANGDLSANYLNFYDKLEKANAFYNDLVEADELTMDLIRERADWYLRSFGTFHLCRELVNKYGLVPTAAMGEVDENYDDALTMELLRDKVKADALVLLKMSSQVEKMAKKSALMAEVYQFLAKVFGNPSTEFDYEGETFSPQEFKARFLGDELENYVTVTPFDIDALTSSYAYVPNLYLNGNETILHATLPKIKEAIVKQLISGVSVWFSAEESTSTSYSEWMLDDQFYDFAEKLAIPRLPVTDQLALDIINYDHAMCITGALTKNNAAEQYRVDNSFGARGKYGGQMLMTNSFLEHCVITLILQQKFLV